MVWEWLGILVERVILMPVFMAFLAGAYYGYETFPQARKEGLVDKDRIIKIARNLFKLVK